MRLKKLIYILIICIFQPLFSQEKQNEPLFILFNESRDKHIEKPNEIDLFRIYISENQYISFQSQNSDDVKRLKNFENLDFVTRNELKEIINNNSENKSLVFTIVRKSNQGNYILYSSSLLN